MEIFNILVVEDEPMIRFFLMEKLEEAGFCVTGVGNGLEALRLLDRLCVGEVAQESRESSASQRKDHAGVGELAGRLPDLVLTDLTMPLMGGAELLRALKGRPHLRQLPVAVLSGEANAARIASRLGAAMFFSKSSSPSEVIEGLRSLLGQTSLKKAV